jgi:hypothetical protein
LRFKFMRSRLRIKTSPRYVAALATTPDALLTQSSARQRLKSSFHTWVLANVFLKGGFGCYEDRVIRCVAKPGNINNLTFISDIEIQVGAARIDADVKMRQVFSYVSVFKNFCCDFHFLFSFAWYAI